MAKNIKNPPVPPHTTAIRGLVMLSAAFAVLISLLSCAYGHPDSRNWLGLIGMLIGKGLFASFGIGSYLAAVVMGIVGWKWLMNKPIRHPLIRTLYIIAMVGSCCILLSLLEDNMQAVKSALTYLFYPAFLQKKIHYHLGGGFFYYIYHDIPGINLLYIFNSVGTALIASTIFLASLFFLTETTPAQALQYIVKVYQYIKGPSPDEEVEVRDEDVEDTSSSRLVGLRTAASPPKDSNNTHQEMLAIQPETELTERPSVSQKLQADKKLLRTEVNEIPHPPAAVQTIAIHTASDTNPAKKRQNALNAQKVYNGDFRSYKLPPPALLTTAKKVDQSSLKQDLRRQAEVLEETLLSFGIEAKVGQINCGPSITSFEVHPAIGVKVQKIRTLENDIALNMEAKSIRIIAPIPGKAAVGIEVPNPQPQEVGFKEMLQAYQQGSRKFHIPILLGKAVNGDYVMSDLTKMPHCIIAGATGSGKSVCINTIVMAILMNARPDEIKLIMVDPKKVELTSYTKLPHMLAPVITEPQGACAALNWLVKEMENRYDILKQLGVRNIEAFNSRTVNKGLEEALDMEIPARLPYIVVIIDELADLMMVSSNDIETPIARIAQMARAVGIHLILATQRPSREVITGIIKANFPTRIAFKVASRVNSQIILDEVGAETLLGNGDMLFLPPGTSTLIRAQGAFIRDEDIAATVKQICDQAPPNYVIASFDDLGQEEVGKSGELESSNDTLYDQAKEIVLNSGNASTTFLQRKLKIGYARAASLIDELESNGVIGATEGSKARKVLSKHGSNDEPEELE